MQAHNQPVKRQFPGIPDARRSPRFKLEVSIKVTCRSCGTLNGYTVDISETGISAMLKLEVPVGELVELAFALPPGRVKVYAMVRQRNAFRYGFQFVDSSNVQEIIRSTCRELAVEQSLFGTL